MAITVNGFDNNGTPDQNSLESLQGSFIRQIVRLVLSGTYPAGGDTLTIAAIQPPNSRGLAWVKIWSDGPSGSIGANGGNFQYVPGASALPATSPNGKVKIFATAGSEYSGSYTTDATTDLIFAELSWKR